MPEPRNAQGTAEPVPRAGVFTLLSFGESPTR